MRDNHNLNLYELIKINDTFMLLFHNRIKLKDKHQHIYNICYINQTQSTEQEV